MAIPAYYSLLQRGSSGPDVALVQTWLNGVRDACTWYSELKTDGKFGISTENAVKEFQLKNKMNVDGKVGANTWNVLYTRYTAKHGLHVPYPGIALRSGSSGGTVRLVQPQRCSGSSAATALPPTARSAKEHGRRCSDHLQVVKRSGMAAACALAIFSGIAFYYLWIGNNCGCFRSTFSQLGP